MHERWTWDGQTHKIKVIGSWIGFLKSKGNKKNCIDRSSINSEIWFYLTTETKKMKEKENQRYNVDMNSL
jgi:hypothetical protein